MKQVFSLLLAFVFLQTQTWAIGGGPAGSVNSSTNLNGDYAGTLLPDGEDQFNGLGLFTLTLKQKGLGTGDFVYFQEGKTFNGTMTGLADPAKQTFSGLVKGQFDIIVEELNLTDQTFGDANLTVTEPGGFANGIVRAKFKAGENSVAGTGSALRLKGQAKMDISELSRKNVTDDGGTPNDPTDDVTTQQVTVTTTNTLILVVDGFQQASAAVDALTGL